MPRKLLPSCIIPPLTPQLSLCMKVSRDPYSFIMNAVLLLPPPLKLCLGSEPMDAVNYVIPKHVSYIPEWVVTHNHPSKFHPDWWKSRNSRSREVADSAVRPPLHPEWKCQLGGQSPEVMEVRGNLPMGPRL